ncbi:hypothetical protein AAMO2058_000213300 [Amorphochlora amoebiformis]|uniref:Mini-chromosome maintenance complex-binding protein n=1 Tax=Amorphochlora amoebiformis TaxID=1561963 RepID=A0A7S0DS86_9EUKA|mmetsp:Transcript_6994/g.10832  ORF Transcript_6994/g.10832 Transcript_6994/m.10832 type:complete len:588 (+) Transcript_6994:23-1786(+)
MDVLIRNPLSVVRARAREIPVGKLRQSSDWGIPGFFESKLKLNEEGDALNEIPSLNVTASQNIEDKSLVRFRCMVQDILDPEFYTGIYEEVCAKTGTKVLKTAKYQDVVDIPAGCDISIGQNSITYSRLPLFCIPIPGESKWVHRALGNKMSQQIQSKDGKQRDKRKRSEVARSTPEKSHVPRITKMKRGRPGESKFEDLAPMDEVDYTSRKGSSTADPHIWNLQKGVMVKMYDTESGKFKVNDVVEFVGVFSASPLLADEDEDGAWGRFNPPSSLVPRLHVITSRKLDSGMGLVPSLDAESFIKKLNASRKPLLRTRASLLAHLKDLLGGDSVASEAMLMHLVSRVHYRRSGHIIGKFSLGISGVPPKTAMKLISFMESILPAVKPIEVTVSAMNKAAYMPVKDYNLNHLAQGELQAAAGTHIVLDETKLSEGKLLEKGIKNFSAAQQVISAQQLNFDFKYHKITFNTDTPVLILTKGKKSIFKCDCSVDIKGAESRGIREVSEASLRSFREYLLLARTLNVEIPKEITSQIQEDFVALRKANPKLPEASMHLRMGCSRLLATTFLETNLTAKRWTYTGPLFKLLR